MTARRMQHCRPGTCTHDVPHGSASTYVNHGCRCDACREANASRKAEMQLVRVDALANGIAGDVEHGNRSTYSNYGCRCSACGEANRLYWRDHRARHKAALS